jgi:hypothetical protein
MLHELEDESKRLSRQEKFENILCIVEGIL